MAERAWNPRGGRSYEDYAVRVEATALLLHKLLGAHGSLPESTDPPASPPSPHQVRQRSLLLSLAFCDFCAMNDRFTKKGSGQT
jgi:hypothetical protein